MAGTYNFSELNGFIRVIQTGGSDPKPKTDYPKASFRKIRLGNTSTSYVVVEFADHAYAMYPSVDTVIVAGTTYGVGGQAKTADELMDILSASGIFPTNYLQP